MTKKLSAAIVLIVGAFAAFGFAADDEPKVASWANEKLPVKDGLVVWLDAARITEGRAAMGLSSVNDGDAIDLWPDASGNGFHIKQPNKEIQPTFHDADGFRTLRFSGKRSFMAGEGIHPPLDEATIFVVAAPYSHRGGFAGLVALSSKTANDFTSGVNIDQGSNGATSLDTINVEGAGMPGQSNLMRDSVTHGKVVRLCLTSRPGKGGVALSYNEVAQGSRDRKEGSKINVERLTVGARYYSLGGAPETTGFFHGDIAEVLVYNRALDNDQQQKVEAYLGKKYGLVLRRPGAIHRTEGKELVRVENPPHVQMFAPGFNVRKLPVDLLNVNNILYRPDGKLVALGYDGNIFLLSDTDGDGLEDKVEQFWDNKGSLRAPIGMCLTPPGYEKGQGVFVAAKGKCSLIVDTDKDDVADKEIIVADGWKEIWHGVDSLGVDIDPSDNSIYFGLATGAFTDPYGAKAKNPKPYPLDSERGTILHVAPDFKSREIVATGIRFPVAVRFNKNGDLFCTDQEGATWLPNGNPLDELLHIQKGRHYGFPPRHPKFLPDVIDEPSVVDYRPQHESTCGLTFNDSVNGGPTFGPEWWASDAFVTAYSRGKLFRSKLVKTASGYVGQNQYLASFDRLLVDTCVTPTGDLIASTHEGGGDWGVGPTGNGVLYKISYTQKDLPQPVAAWASSPREVRIAFDRPLQDSHLTGLQAGTKIEYGTYVMAGERFEVKRPGYQVVQDQLYTPRFDLPVLNVQVMPDRRTLLLSTAQHPMAAVYAVTLPGLGRPKAEESSGDGALPQVPESDLSYELHGVTASWKSAGGKTTWSGWLPHVDFKVAKALTSQSAEHAALWKHLESAGELTMTTALNLKDMLRPAIQPGEKIDYEWPEETTSVRLMSRVPFKLKSDGEPVEGKKEGDAYVANLTLKKFEDRGTPLEITLSSGENADLHLSWSTNEDDRPRAFALERFLLPWAPLKKIDEATLRSMDIPELAGGNWSRGRKLFYSDEATCYKCHTFNGEGGNIGPDLSNLPQRDYASVHRDIMQPSFAINPDYIAQNILLTNGKSFSGVLRSKGADLLLGDDKGVVTTIHRDDIDVIEPAKISIMPEGILTKLGPDKTRDLLTFLLSPPPRMPDYGKTSPPDLRSREEVNKVLAGGVELPSTLKPLNIVLVAGRKDHGPGEHDYPAWKKVWSRLFAMADAVEVSTADEWPSAEQLEKAHVLVFYQQGTWNKDRAKDMDAFFARGGGAVYIHYAVDGTADPGGFAERIGLAWRGGGSRFRHGDLDIQFRLSESHPIARNFDKLHLHDESYWQLVGDPKKITLLGTGPEDGKDQPLFWTHEPGKGRVFVSIPGHFSWSFDDPLFRIVLLRGIAWTANELIDRFNSLIYPGARIGE